MPIYPAIVKYWTFSKKMFLRIFLLAQLSQNSYRMDKRSLLTLYLLGNSFLMDGKTVFFALNMILEFSIIISAVDLNVFNAKVIYKYWNIGAPRRPSFWLLQRAVWGPLAFGRPLASFWGQRPLHRTWHMSRHVGNKLEIPQIPLSFNYDNIWQRSASVHARI